MGNTPTDADIFAAARELAFRVAAARSASAATRDASDRFHAAEDAAREAWEAVNAARGRLLLLASGGEPTPAGCEPTGS